ncbi:hypothetical protein AOQ84DRAFT_287254, partial [Glonium stellatum]
IDKASSVELSEAINSMYTWYKNAEVCFTHLSSVHSSAYQLLNPSHSRWFKREWTP